MINKDTLIKVVNKYNGTVGYNVPDLGVHRNFYPNESKDITFDELEKLSFAPGGEAILKDFLEIQNKEAQIEDLHKTIVDSKELFSEIEAEIQKEEEESPKQLVHGAPPVI